MFLQSLPETLLRNQYSPGHSGWQTTSDSPEGPLFQNPIRQNSEQYYLCVCVYIYYIANEQIAAMWHGLMAWPVKKKETHADTHSSPQPPSSLFSPQYTHLHTHTPYHKAPSVLGLSLHQLMRSAGLGVVIITLLSGGLTKGPLIHTHTHTCTQFSQRRETAR